MWKTVYRLDHKHFDQDMDTCILLTNENILKRSLEEQDRHFHLAMIEEKKKKQEQLSVKRKQSLERYRANKRARIRAELM